MWTMYRDFDIGLAGAGHCRVVVSKAARKFTTEKAAIQTTALVSMSLVLVDGNASSTVAHMENLLTEDSTYTIVPLTHTTQSNVACMKTEGCEGKWHSINLKTGVGYAPDMSCVRCTSDSGHMPQRVFRTF